jgi:hypothetical protein
MADTTGCARPTGASLNVKVDQTTSGQQTNGQTPESKEVRMIQARVGKPAPDFTAPTYHQGTFKSVKLSDYLGKWTMLCFYPGDFTFV